MFAPPMQKRIREREYARQSKMQREQPNELLQLVAGVQEAKMMCCTVLVCLPMCAVGHCKVCRSTTTWGSRRLRLYG